MHHMKKLINVSLILALLVVATATASAKTVKGTPATTPDSTDVVVYDAPNVFADDVVAIAAPAYNIFTTNVFADDVFADDVKTNDVLVADVVTADPSASHDGLTVANLEIGPEPTNGLLDIKTEATGKLVYYTEPHTDKAGNIINGGENTLYVEKIVSPGVFYCRFEGFDGNITHVTVVCKK